MNARFLSNSLASQNLLVRRLHLLLQEEKAVAKKESVLLAVDVVVAVVADAVVVVALQVPLVRELRARL